MSYEQLCPQNVIDRQKWRDREHIFEDRAEAGRALAEMMNVLRGTDALVLGVPAGGVPVAAPLAEELGLELDVAVVSKITLPWNPEAGYGAVAFDGTVRINQPLRERLGLSDAEVEEGIVATRDRVERRVRELRGEEALPDVSGRTVVLCDDGLASGFTMLTAVEAVRGADPAQVIVAVPTAHTKSVERIVEGVDCVYCCNLRGGMHFAVATAYRHWRDVPLEEAKALLEQHGRITN
jgi:putative phosphoribosyl transferase